MPEDVVSPDTAAPGSAEIPEDFAAYEQWRNKGGDPVAAAEEEISEAEPAEEAKPEPEPAPESDPESDQEDEKPSRGLQKRFDKLTRKIHELEAQLAQNAQAPESKPGVVPAAEEPPKPAGKPKLEDFKGPTAYDDWIEALADWKVEQRLQAREQEARQRAAQEAEQKVLDDWQTRVKAAADKHDDFHEVIGEANVPIHPAMRDAMLRSEIGPEITYHLAKNRAEAERIAALAPIDAVRELGKLEAKLTAPPPEPKKPVVSKAPPPAKPVSGTKASTPSIYDAKYENDFAAYERLRKAQLAHKKA